MKMNGKCFLLEILYGGKVGPEGRVRFKFQKQGRTFSPHIVNIPAVYQVLCWLLRGDNRGHFHTQLISPPVYQVLCWLLLGDNRDTTEKTTEKVSALTEVALSRLCGRDKVQVTH